MLAGESSGGFAVCHILAAPEAAGLISAAAIQSGPCSLRVGLNDQVALASYFDTAINLHRPIVAHTALSNETVGNIPLIVGATADEAALFFGENEIPDDAAYRARLAVMFEDPIDDQVYALYPTADFPSAQEAFLTFWGDWIFNCEAEELARSATSNACPTRWSP